MVKYSNRAVVLLSGGMDSCVCATLAARDYDTAAVHVSYGQRTEEREQRAFFAICDRLEIRHRLLVRNEALSAIGGSALTDSNIAVPQSHAIGFDIPVTYVPFRNAHFLSVAVSWAEVLGARKVYIGAVEQDSSGYPDCRPAYYQAFNKVVKLGTRNGGIEIVNLSDGSLLKRLQSAGPLTRPVLSHDASRLAAWRSDTHSVEVLDVKSGQR